MSPVLRQNCAPVVHRNGHSNHVACNSIVPSGRFCSECGARFVCCGLCLTGSLSAPIVPPDASLRLDAGRPSVCRCIRFRISLSSNETGNGLTLPFRLSIPCPRLQRARLFLVALPIFLLLRAPSSRCGPLTPDVVSLWMPWTETLLRAISSPWTLSLAPSLLLYCLRIQYPSSAHHER